MGHQQCDGYSSGGLEEFEGGVLAIPLVQNQEGTICERGVTPSPMTFEAGVTPVEL